MLRIVTDGALICLRIGKRNMISRYFPASGLWRTNLTLKEWILGSGISMTLFDSIGLFQRPHSLSPQQVNGFLPQIANKGDKIFRSMFAISCPALFSIN